MKAIELLSGSACKDPHERSCVGYDKAFWDDQRCPLKINDNILIKSKWCYFMSLDGVFHFVPKGTKCLLKAQIKDKNVDWIEKEENFEMVPRQDLLVITSPNNEIHGIVPLYSIKEDAEKFQRELQKMKDHYGYLNIMIELSKWYHR